ncbi:MAG: glycoside hydrolase family 12 protein [Planctomycetota bacterium]|jgi:hypothetical protein
MHPVLLSLALILLAVIAVVPLTPSKTDSTVILAEDRWAELPLSDGWRLINNIWRGGRGHQHLTRPEPGTVGWRWWWHSISEEVVSYPALVNGYRPWDSERPDPLWPLPLAEIDDMALDLAAGITSSDSAEYNFAFDLWVMDPSQRGPEAIRGEIMVWLDRRGGWPSGAMSGWGAPLGVENGPVATLTINQRSYELFIGTFGDGTVSWPVWTFIPTPLTQAVSPGPIIYQDRIDLMPFLDVLAERDLTDPKWSLAGIEIGTELRLGRGAATIHDCRLHLKTNGNDGASFKALP